MGAFLEAPITKKDTESGGGNGIAFAVSQMQGWRSSMEDAHTAAAEIPGLPGCSFFAVFDGHAGSYMSRICSTAVLKRVVETLGPKSGSEPYNPTEIENALRTSFLAVDQEQRSLCQDGSGTTAVAVFLSPTHIIVANCGDSRIVIARAGGEVWGSIDHKPASEGEKLRIDNAGGFVAMNRVNGCLAVSRALGDYEFKKRTDLSAESQQVSGEPECTVLSRLPTDEFLVLCCDGVWDVVSNEECVAEIRKRASSGNTLAEITDGLLDKCLELGSRDNMTACLIQLQLPAAPVPGVAAAASGAVSGGGSGGSGEADGDVSTSTPATESTSSVPSGGAETPSE